MSQVREPHFVFFSYASPDYDRVAEFYDYLKNEGIPAWLDRRRLLAGQNWNFEIQRAMERADIIILFLSNNSIDRRGYLQRELKRALELSTERLIDDIFIIPVILDDELNIPAELKHLHHIYSSKGDARQSLSKSIRFQFDRLGSELAEKQERGGISWDLDTFKETWDGLPGYDISVQFIKFRSEAIDSVSQISDVVRGWIVDSILSERRVKINQSPDLYSFGQATFLRQNSIDLGCGGVSITNKVISIVYTVLWYPCGAAHSQIGQKTFSFTLDPITQINDLNSVFYSPDDALSIIQSEARSQLLKDRVASGGDTDRGWIDRGTAEWSSFRSFVFAKDGVQLLFPPYQVDCFAAGTKTALVPYSGLEPVLIPYYRHALGFGLY